MGAVLLLVRLYADHISCCKMHVLTSLAGWLGFKEIMCI